MMNSTSYMILTLIVSPLLGGGLVYYIQSRIRINESKEQASIAGAATAAQTPYQVLQQQLQAKDGQIAMTQQQHYQFVESQMARNDATTKAILELAAECRAQTDTLKAVGASLQDHREESSTRAGKIYEKIGDVNERMAAMETGVKNAIDSAGRASDTALQAVREARLPRRTS